MDWWIEDGRWRGVNTDWQNDGWQNDAETGFQENDSALNDSANIAGRCGGFDTDFKDYHGLVVL